MKLKVSTWNINSVRLRLPIVLQFLAQEKPHVLCLQETKCRDAEFPLAAFKEAGYKHIAINGQKGYHGVATLSRVPIELAEKRAFCEKGDARHLSVQVTDKRAEGLVLHNFYVPAGGDEPDPVLNPKFAHKLQFLDEMRAWFAAHKVASGHAMLVGDLNVAPLEHDVWSHKQMLKIVSHTPVEVERLARAVAAGPWIDAMRHLVPHTEKLYTWWSYRAADWSAADRGRRLDHVWVSKALAPGIGTLKVERAARGWDRPSDHVPVTMTLNL